MSIEVLTLRLHIFLQACKPEVAYNKLMHKHRTKYNTFLGVRSETKTWKENGAPQVGGDARNSASSMT